MKHIIKSSNSYRNIFEGRELTIATMHGKELVIAPVVKEYLEVNTIIQKNLNTDSLGTFSGEIERKDDALTTLRKKCMMALEVSGGDLVIGNEGSFGPHPSLFFVAANEEMMMLIDTKNNIEIVAKEISTKTNFAGEEIKSEKALKDFAKRVGFPDHGIILKERKEAASGIFKGIRDWETLTHGFRSIYKTNGKVYVETDMRAMHNPTRMEVIKSCSIKLMENISSVCTKCSWPGFVVKDVVSGLPCEICNMPTRSTLKHIYKCSKCAFVEERLFPNSREKEDAMYCDFCNP
ncbi:MAG: DUF6671 family protein [Bacteroidota bacterium]